MSLVNAFGALALDETVQDVVDKLDAGINVTPSNITGKFRESFENFTPGVNWNLTTGSGDIVQLDGNAVSASYLVISKDPLTANTETSLTYTGSFPMPIESAVGLSMSQRVLGQELSMELVSTETPITPVADIAISSISQSTTTLTVTTSAAHGLIPGVRIGVRSVTSDSRLNYPSLVILTIINATQFTCNAGPGGTIPSLSVGPYTSQGFVYVRSAMGGARNGMSEIFENASATNASMYFRSASGDALPSSTFGGNQSVTVSTTASTVGISSPYTYAFLPASEYRFSLQADRGIVYDVVIDSAGGQSSRLVRTQVVPDPTKEYTLRFRMTNNEALTVPVAKIVSVAKSGSTTATVTTAEAHGLTTGDYIVGFGVRDTTNFAALSTPQVVASVINSTSFTVVWGAAVTATSYGGMVARANGSNVPTSFNQGSSGSVITAQGISGELQLTASNTYVFVVGDYVNVYGVRNNSTGADLGVDGVYRVVDVSTSVCRLSPIGETPAVSTFGSTACGGLIIKRTDARISFVRIFEYVRQRVEMLAQPTAANATQVNVLGGTIGVSTVSGGAIGTQFFPTQLANDIASAALTSSNTSASITPANNSSSFEYNVMVTAVSGTNPTLDVVVQESDDSGTNWYDIYHFPRITAIGQYRSPLIPQTGNRVRYVRTVTGTSPSFTNSVNRLQSNTPQPVQKQFFDRTIVPTTLNSVTPSFFTEGCVDLNVMMSFGTMTTAPVLVLEGSVNNVDWYQIGADITPTASATTLVQASNAQNRFTRIRVKTAGATIVFGYVAVKGAGR
jgi:hypothetical protein